MVVRYVELTQDVIDEFVLHSHGNYGRVRQLLLIHPQLAVQQSSWGETALDAALHAQQPEIERFLRSAGAVTSKQGCDGMCEARIEKLNTDFTFKS